LTRQRAAREECKTILREVRRVRANAAANANMIAADYLDLVIKYLIERDAPKRKKSKQRPLELVPVAPAPPVDWQQLELKDDARNREYPDA
jgi:hypothetical protein